VSIEDDLEPKLADIRRLARETYGLYLGAMGLGFNEDGVIDFDPTEVSTVDVVDLEYERGKWARFSSEVDELCARFQRFYGLDPLDLTVITGMLGGPPGQGRHTVVEESGTNVPAMLNNAWDPWVSRVDGMINEGQWEGEAALQFHQTFLWPFEDAVEQQMAYAKILAAVSDRYHDAVSQGLDNLRAVADATIAALGGESGGGGDSGGFYTVAGLLVDIVGFIPVAGTAADIVGFALDIGGAYDEYRAAEPRPILVEGLNAPMIIESAWNAFTDLEADFVEADKKLSDRLEGYLDSRSCFASSGLEIDRPAMADGTDAFDASKLPASPQTPSQSPLVVELVSLYTAGYVNLPAAAERYEFARDKLASCTLPHKVSTFFPRSTSRFDEARNQLTRIVRRTRDNLADAGAAIVVAATDYHLTDQESAVRLDRLREVDPPQPPVYNTPVHGPL
jgi:hypothetical protein